MGTGSASIRKPGLNGDPVEAWPREIRDYLLGRLAVGQQSIPLPVQQTQQLSHAPIRRWWIFEGKRYPSIEGTLASRWIEVVRAAGLLERTFNPRLKLSERPDGTIDWAHTFARGPVGVHAEYVLRSSGIGLGEEEHAALRGWTRWIAAEWVPYAERFGLTLPTPAQRWFEAVAVQDCQGPASVEQLRRWVYIARRSRWPLLRDLVAETLRVALEPDALDHIPLPIDRPRLFELLCLVRIARRIAPPPDELRWLDLEMTANKLILTGATCWYQQALEREAVLNTPDYEGLSEVASVFGLRMARHIDLAFDLDPPRHGINGIIVEAKSGSQGFDAAVAQLQVYRRSRPRGANHRYLVWGIVEKAPGNTITEAQLDWLRREIDSGSGDVWAFSAAESIGAVLELLGCPSGAAPTGAQSHQTPLTSTTV